MSEEKFYNSEHPNLPEHSSLPEHSVLPEYNPVYPDVSFFKESAVTTREENIFQGEPPAGESRRLLRKEKQKERERFSLLQRLLGVAARGGAAVLAAVVVVSAVSFSQDGDNAFSIRKAIRSAQRPAFTQQTGYDTDALIRLWERDPDAPHKYDTENPLVYREATCTQDGEAEYVCLECGVHAHTVIAATGHTAGDPVRENVVEATCQSEGGYTEVVTCTVCGQELSRTNVVVAKLDHTPGEPTIENRVEATCEEDGHYDETITCTVCGEVISSGPVTIPATGHKAAAAVRENETEATCEEAGGYDNVVYCSECNKELSRDTVTVAALGHTAAAAVKENEVAATCTEGGHYDNVVYCSTCQKEMSRTTVTSAATGHTAAAAVKENEVAATCTEGGHYDNVVYCSGCNMEMSRTTVQVAALGHNWGTPTYTWASDGSTVTAERVCGNDSSHKETETMQAARTVTSEATCETGETVRCTASFSNSAFTTQTKTFTGEPLGHDWEAVYEWGETDTGGLICYAYAYCLRDESHTAEEEIEGTRSTVEEPTCEDEGIYRYTASFSNSAFTTQTEEAPAPALGHDYQYLKEYEDITCTTKRYYYVSKCSRCDVWEPDAVASRVEEEPGDGHNWISSGGQITCGNCGNVVVEAYYYGNYVHYYLSSDYMEEKNLSVSRVQLWSYDAGEYINSGGYEGGYSSEMMLGDNYRVNGAKFRVDVTFSDGSTVRSNDVEYSD